MVINIVCDNCDSNNYIELNNYLKYLLNIKIRCEECESPINYSLNEDSDNYSDSVSSDYDEDD